MNRLSMQHVATIAATVVALASAPAAAQFPQDVRPGVRVRLWLPDAQRQEETPWKRQRLRATVADVGGDVLQLEVPGTSGTVTINRADIRRLDVSKGTSRAVSAVERAFGFAVAGAINAAISNDPAGRRWPNFSSTGRAAAEGAKWGAAFGAILGFALPSERWRRVLVR